MKYILNLEEKHEHAQDHVNSIVWYNAEGGQRNCLEYHITVTDENNNRINDKTIPLKAVLYYENGSRVEDQRILEVKVDSKLVIDHSEHAAVRIRINDVSNKHMGYLFVVKIHIDNESSLFTPDMESIEAVAGMAIEVKSKRNQSKSKHQPDAKRQRVSVSPEYTPATAVVLAPPSPDVYASSNNMMALSQHSQNVLGEVAYHLLSWNRSLDHMMWKQVSYEKNDNGTFNLSKPIYDKPCPNESMMHMSEQIKMVQKGLWQLQQSIVDLESYHYHCLNKQQGWNKHLPIPVAQPIPSMPPTLEQYLQSHPVAAIAKTEGKFYKSERSLFGDDCERIAVREKEDVLAGLSMLSQISMELSERKL